MHILWFCLSVFVLGGVAVPSPTTEVPTLDKDEVSVNFDLDKLAARFTENYIQPNKCNCSVEIVEAETNNLCGKKQNRSEFDFNFLYINQIEEINGVSDNDVENSILWILLGKSKKAAKRFNQIPNNILHIKLVVDEVISDGLENVPKLLEFVDSVEGYEQKILMAIMLYNEFMKSIDVTILPQFQATIAKLVATSEFDLLNSFYQDQFKTMNLVLKALDGKVEAFIPKENPGDITMEQKKDSLSDCIQQQTGNPLYNLI